MKKLMIVVGLGVAIVTAGAVLLTTGDGANEPPNRAVSANEVVAAASDITASAALAQSAASSIAPKDEGSSTTLYARSRTATDLRVFVEAVKREIEKGGAFYANEALLQCRLLRSVELRPEKAAALRRQLTVAADEVAKRRLASLDWLERRCDGFTDAELGGDEQNYLHSWGVAKDPLMALRRRAHQLDRSGTEAKLQC